jgi:hypothetical protein
VSDHEEDEPAAFEYEMVMPFVTVATKGGPHEDVAYVAGWECGTLDRDLALATEIRAVPDARVVQAASVPQVDLIAMKHGFVATFEDAGDDYQTVTFGWA